jgi:hypothetical protein
MQIISSQKDSDGNTCYFRSPDAGYSVLLMHAANVARYPRHDYPVLCLRLSCSDRVLSRPDGSVEFRPTPGELRGLFAAVKAVHSEASVRIEPGQESPSDPTDRSRDALVSIVKREGGFALRLLPTEHTRARWLRNGAVEFMPRSSELGMLAKLHNVLEPSLRVTLASDFVDKPESRRTRWARINAERCGRRKSARGYNRHAWKR